MPTWSLSDTAKIAFKIGLYLTFTASLVAFTYWLGTFTRDIYTVIQTTANSISSTGSSSGLFGCIMSTLGLDVFLTSFISIFFSATSFWGLAVAYTSGFKFVKTGYDMLYKATT